MDVPARRSADARSGSGQRPVIADNKVVQGQLLAIMTYCPDELQQFTDFVNSLKYADVGWA